MLYYISILIKTVLEIDLDFVKCCAGASCEDSKFSRPAHLSDIARAAAADWNSKAGSRGYYVMAMHAAAPENASDVVSVIGSVVDMSWVLVWMIWPERMQKVWL